jgi:thiamine-monophosphate kinase
MKSDEPTRLAEFVSTMFRLDTKAVVRVSADAEAKVTHGADAQDDCAVVRMRGEQDLVVGSDYVRGPKFRLYELGLLSLFDLGYYLVAANVSDVAAMGARPLGLLSVVRYPPEMPDSEFVDVLSGIQEAARAFGCPSIGGDIGGAERLFLCATALGVCRSGRALMRSGAKPGDILCVTGPTGLAGAAMAYLRTGERVPEIERNHRQALLNSWRRPQARVRAGIRLGESGFVTSCQDTSDGLKAAILGIAEASGVGFLVDQDKIPIAAEVRAVCHNLGLDPLATVLGDSVDFELAFTVPADAVGHFDCYPIGEATGEPGVLLRARDGGLSELPGAAWRHAPEPVTDEIAQGKDH